MLKYNHFPNILITLGQEKTRIFFILYKYLWRATQEKHHHHIHLFILLLFNIDIELYTSLISSCWLWLADLTQLYVLDGAAGVCPVCVHTLALSVKMVILDGYSGDARASFKNRHRES